ncbi:MAG: hypothetical protein AMS25_08270 [Gemmatimonas sp. SM23_52]|nr:MAG: hypothetical protein AMS25_08270 [Gemmatimonas sp. SM23_52]
MGLTARFAISGAVAVGAGYSNTSLGGSMGYRANAEPPGWFSGEHVISHWDATMAWVGAFWKPHPAVRLGGGPGWYQLENYDARAVKVSQVGLMVEVGAEVPAARRFFLDLAIRLHLVPAKNVEHGRTVPITLRPNWTHAALLAGLGLHL